MELTAAINSMFRLYQKAARCYVYLADVSVGAVEQQKDHPDIWEPAFRRSRWFTRAWTVQELIAPLVVQFFSSQGVCLGDKSNLKPLVSDITGITAKALEGQSLSDFSVEERLSWARGRKAKLEEDEIYSLLGIFDTSMPMIYGEGKDKAWIRLEGEVRKSMTSKKAAFSTSLCMR